MHAYFASSSWSHNPVATLSICLLAQVYTHACDLLHLFGEFEVIPMAPLMPPDDAVIRSQFSS